MAKRILASWWLALLLVGCLSFIEGREGQRREERKALIKHKEVLEARRDAELALKEELEWRLHRLKEGDGEEQLLIDELGVIPPGTIRVDFLSR